MKRSEIVGKISNTMKNEERDVQGFEASWLVQMGLTSIFLADINIVLTIVLTGQVFF